jgi:hypothetical protein
MDECTFMPNRSKKWIKDLFDEITK